MNLSRLIEITTDTDIVLTIVPSSDCTQLTYAINGGTPKSIRMNGVERIALLECTTILAQLLRTSNDAEDQADQVLERIRLNLRHLLCLDGEFLGTCCIASCRF